MMLAIRVSGGWSDSMGPGRDVAIFLDSTDEVVADKACKEG